MNDNFARMMAGSLDLKEPWYIKAAEFDETKRVLHIYVDIRKNADIPCPHCGGRTVRYGYEPEERTWRHGDCLFFPTLVHCRRPRVKCNKCGTVQVNAPFERPHSRFTLLFEGFAMLLMADVPRRKLAEVLRCDEKSLASINNYWVNKAESMRSLEQVTHLAIDETSFKRGHNYVSIVIDAVNRSVIDVQPGRDKIAIQKFSEKLKQRGGSADNIKAVTSDMSTSFLPAIAENFPNAINIIDKFHVKQVVLTALDKVRRKEQQSVEDKKSLFRGRKLFMKRASTLDSEQTKTLKELSKRYPLTGRAARIVAGLDDFYQSVNEEEAAKSFEALYSWMRRCRLKPMKEVAETLKCHKKQILGYFADRLTNAVCEGINSMIQAAKRKARGFNTYKGFISMIYLIAGKLELQTPKPFSHFH